MFKIIAALSILTGCTDRSLNVGDCYSTEGDFGVDPSSPYCVQATGRDGWVSCQGSADINKKWNWYNCGHRAWYMNARTIVKCPLECPRYGK